VAQNPTESYWFLIWSWGDQVQAEVYLGQPPNQQQKDGPTFPDLDSAKEWCAALGPEDLSAFWESQ